MFQSHISHSQIIPHHNKDMINLVVTPDGPEFHLHVTGSASDPDIWCLSYKYSNLIVPVQDQADASHVASHATDDAVAGFFSNQFIPTPNINEESHILHSNESTLTPSSNQQSNIQCDDDSEDVLNTEEVSQMSESYRVLN